MLDIPLEVPLAALPFGRRRECGDTREARVEVLADPLDRAPLAGRVPPLEDDHYPGALRAYPFLQLDQLALQPEQLRLVDLLRQTLDPRIPGHRPSHSRPPPSRRALDVTVVRPRRHGGRRVLQQRRRIATGLRRRTTGVEELFPGPVLAALRDAPGRPAFENRSRTVSRGELLATVRRVAGGLRNAGLGPGSGLGLVLSLSPEAYAVHLAAHALGCRVAAARPGWSRPQLADAMRGKVDAVVSDLPPAGLEGVPVLPLADLLARADPGGSVPELARPDDIARLTYTSGSTGEPKACAHTYPAISLAYLPDRWAPVLAELLTRFKRCLIIQNLASPVMFTYLGRCLVTGGTAVIADGLAMPEAIHRHHDAPEPARPADAFGRRFEQPAGGGARRVTGRPAASAGRDRAAGTDGVAGLRAGRGRSDLHADPGGYRRRSRRVGRTAAARGRGRHPGR